MSSILQKANDLIEEYGSVENYFKAMEEEKLKKANVPEHNFPSGGVIVKKSHCSPGGNSSGWVEIYLRLDDFLMTLRRNSF